MSGANVKQLRVNLYNPFTLLSLEAAMIASYALPVVKIPVFLAKRLISNSSIGAIKFLADRTARGVFYIIRGAVNNGLTRRISPSVSSLDDRIESACTSSGKFLGNVLSLPVYLTFYLAASAFAIAAAFVAIPVFMILSLTDFISHLIITTGKAAYETFFIESKRYAAEYESVPEKAGAVFLHIAWEVAFGLLSIPLAIFIYAAQKTLLLVSAPLTAPLYTLSSLFGLGNRFNIYDYKNDVGTVHAYILDLLDGSLTRLLLLSPIPSDRLIDEATKGSPHSDGVLDGSPETALSSASVSEAAQSTIAK